MAKWSRLISEQKNSGLTIRDFCRQHDLSWHAYYYWLKKIREQIVSELPSGSAGQHCCFTNGWIMAGSDGRRSRNTSSSLKRAYICLIALATMVEDAIPHGYKQN